MGTTQYNWPSLDQLILSLKIFFNFVTKQAALMWRWTLLSLPLPLVFLVPTYSSFQRDHFLLAIDDLFSRYSPKVPKHFYLVRFVPVLDDDEQIVLPDQPVDQKLRKVPHELRSSRYCWCDSHCFASLEMGLMHRFYVIEVSNVIKTEFLRRRH